MDHALLCAQWLGGSPFGPWAHKGPRRHKGSLRTHPSIHVLFLFFRIKRFAPGARPIHILPGCLSVKMTTFGFHQRQFTDLKQSKG